MLADFARWVVSLDEPDNDWQRRHASLALIIDKARDALDAGVMSVSREQVYDIIREVQSRHFTDDDGNDVGVMSSGHAVLGVMLTLATLGIEVTP